MDVEEVEDNSDYEEFDEILMKKVKEFLKLYRKTRDL